MKSRNIGPLFPVCGNLEPNFCEWQSANKDNYTGQTYPPMFASTFALAHPTFKNSPTFCFSGIEFNLSTLL